MKAWLDLPGGKAVEILARCQIGRGKDNDIVLTHDEVSRRHALICRDRAGFWLVDLDSRNGTLLKGIRIYQPESLTDGCEFSVGGHVFKFRMAASRSPRRKLLEALTGRTRQAAGALFAPDSNAAMLLDKAGTLLSQSEEARRLLEEFFPDKTPLAASLPAQLTEWMRHPRAQAKPLFVHRPPKRLVIRHGNAGPDHSLLLLTSEEEAFGNRKLKSLGLSDREAEVTRWIAGGKRNDEIATILNISPRTVEKHVAKILVVLGVETRSAAAGAVLEKLGVLDPEL